MDRYKKYLFHKDAEIPLRTAQRYRLHEDEHRETISQRETIADEMQIQTGEQDVMDVDLDNVVGTDEQSTEDVNYHVEDEDETFYSPEFSWISDLYKVMLTNDRNSYSKQKNLKEFLESEDLFETITTPIDKNRGEIFLMILKYSISNQLSFTGLTNLVKLINSLFRTPILPDSRYVLDKILNPKEGTEYHGICQNCSAYVGKFGDLSSTINCHVCHVQIDLKSSSDSTFFTLIDPSQQIADLVSQYEDHFHYVTNERIHTPGYISDVYDGKKYKEFVKSLPMEDKRNYVSAVFNTDGAPKFKCSQYSIWPLYLLINELPKDIRIKKLVVCGLMFTKKKPNMSVFIDKFVDLVNKCRISVVIKNEERLLKLYVLSCCVDAVARAPIQGLMQYNGKFGCNWCLHPGEYHGIMKYPLTSTPVEPRNHHDTVALMLQAIDPDKPVFGIKYPSALINLPTFDVIEGFTPDYMHMALEGVVKQFASFHLDILHEGVINEFDKTMSMIAVPQQIARYCRPLSCRKDWKAREWENFVLYYSIIIFPIILTSKRMNHWLLFVQALYILLKDRIHIDELNDADRMLYQFVAETEENYSIRHMTYNVHILLHVSKSVLNWGPLWTNSTFCFESANQHLLNATKCAKGVTHQVVRFINISHSCSVLEENIIHDANNDVVRFCNDILLRRVQNVSLSASNDTLYFHKAEIDTEILNTFKLSRNSTEFFYKMIKNRCLYESHLLSKKRSNNSFAMLKEGQFIRIIGFIQAEDPGVEITLCNYVKTKQAFPTYYKEYQEIDRIQADTIAIPTKSIEKVCVYINAHKLYLCPVPNMMHY